MPNRPDECASARKSLGRRSIEEVHGKELLELLRRPQILALLVLLTAVTWTMRRRGTGATRQGTGMANQVKWLSAGPTSPRDERLAVALVAVVVITAITTLGGNISGTFNTIAGKV